MSSPYKDIKVGQTFEFVYLLKESDRIPEHQTFWSTVERRWIPCFGLHVLVSKSNYVLVFVNSKGCFRAHAEDAGCSPTTRAGQVIIPRRV